MKTPKPAKRDSEERTIRLHGGFTAPGHDEGAETRDLLIFLNLLIEARELEQRARWREVRSRERKLRERSALIPKFIKVLRVYLEGEIDAETVARRIKRICPKRELQKELFEYLVTPATAPARSTEELADEEKAITRREQTLRAWRQSTRSVETLAAQAAAGDEDATKNLVDIASHAVQSLVIAERSHPEVARKVARGTMLWPLLASVEPGWEGRAAERLRRLELGKGLEVLRTSFRAARGTDENYPARKWAKAAVRTLEETRRRLMVTIGAGLRSWFLSRASTLRVRRSGQRQHVVFDRFQNQRCEIGET